MSTSPPYALTSSTSLTNCFLLTTEGALRKDATSQSRVDVLRLDSPSRRRLGRSLTHRKSSSETSNLPMAPRSAALKTCDSPYHARNGFSSSILKNLHALGLRQSALVRCRDRVTVDALFEHDAFLGKFGVFELR